MIPSSIRLLFVLALLTLWIKGAEAQSLTSFVTYGTDSPSREGDDDFVQVFFVRIPDSYPDTVFLRIYDPDLGGTDDIILGQADTRTRFSLLGGRDVYTPASTAPSPNPEARQSGQLLESVELGTDPSRSGTWWTLARLHANQGQLVEGDRVFKLVVEGLKGNDANLFVPALTIADRSTVAPHGPSIISYSPTIHIVSGSHVVEMKIELDEHSGSIDIHTFDAAFATVTLETAFQSYDVPSSGQDVWQIGSVQFESYDRANELAVTIAADGRESPNDLTLYVTEGNDSLVPIVLPIRDVVANERPLVAVATNVLADCHSVVFDASQTIDPEASELSFVWNFGDVSSSSGAVTVHRYERFGTYRASLFIRDGSDQVANGAYQDIEVFVNEPPVADAGLDSRLALAQEGLFSASKSMDGDGEIVQYTWDFNDGTTASGQIVNHGFSEPGRYLVTLRVTDNSGQLCNSGVDEVQVFVNAPPVAEAGENIVATVGEPVSFDGTKSYDTDGEIGSYHWDFDDGNTANGSIQTHSYSEAGTFTVSLTVTDNEGLANSQDSDQISVFVVDPPVARAGDDRLVAVGELVSFDGTASTDRDGEIIRYEWNFGDGNNGVGDRVDYAYSRSGVYTVSLTVFDNSGFRQSSGSDQLKVVVNQPPVSQAGSDQLVTSSAVAFDGQASSDADGNISSYRWDFGDGEASASPNPVHVYTRPGTYEVELTVTDNSGAMRNQDRDAMQVVVNASPIADAGPDHVVAPGESVRFDGTNSVDPDGTVSDWSWSFGDGSGGTGPVTQHAYSRPGTYVTVLSIQDNTGHERAVDYDETIVTVNAQPVADAGPDVLVAVDENVRLDGSNSYDPDGQLSYRWNFSDGESQGTMAVVVRRFAVAGIYTARLTVSDGSGTANATDQDEVIIFVNHSPVSVAGYNIHTCSYTVELDGSASSDPDGDPLTYTWAFGDGSPAAAGAQVFHTFQQTGSYPVVLTVDDGTGLSNSTSMSSLTVQVNAPPVANAGENRTVCTSDRVLFDGSESSDAEGGLLKYAWDFGHDEEAAGVNPTTVYKEGGVYPVTLTVTDDSGLDICNGHTIQVAVNVIDSPVASAGPDQTVCTNAEVRFDGALSTDVDGIVNRYTWDFGDGETGGGISPKHVYDRPSEYTVTLIIHGDELGQCDNTDTDVLIVSVIEAPVARFESAPYASLGATVTFDATASTSAESSPLIAWRWDFGDGQTAEGESASHTFSQPGAKIVTLEITTGDSTSSCSVVTTQRSIIVNSAPDAVIVGPAIVNTGEPSNFSAAMSSDIDGTITSYEWDFGDGTTASGLEVQHAYLTPGQQTVRLTVTDDSGAPNKTVSETVSVLANHAPVLVLDSPSFACVGEPSSLRAGASTDGDSQNLTFEWDFGDGNTASGATVQHTFAEIGSYDIRLVADDGTGVTSGRQDTVSVILVNRRPVAKAGPDRVVCPDETISFDASASADLDWQRLSYSWNFGDGSNSEGESVTHRYSDSGSYTVNLTADDGTGSSCSTSSDGVAIYVNARPEASAGSNREAFVGGAHDAILFDATASTDSDGHSMTYTWDFGDGSTQLGSKVWHRYLSEGTHTVTLTAQDETDLPCGIDTAQIQVDVRVHQ